jgi:hypothetical protein
VIQCVCERIHTHAFTAPPASPMIMRFTFCRMRSIIAGTSRNSQPIHKASVCVCVCVCWRVCAYVRIEVVINTSPLQTRASSCVRVHARPRMRSIHVCVLACARAPYSCLCVMCVYVCVCVLYVTTPCNNTITTTPCNKTHAWQRHTPCNTWQRHTPGNTNLAPRRL